MASSKNTTGKRTAEGTPPAERNGAERQAVYFLSLSLENVRCFGPKQTLDLSDGKGKPAPWTIILGLNGTGKTTVLQSLVGCEPSPTPAEDAPKHLALWPRLLIRFRDDPYSFRRGDRQQPSEWRVTVAASSSLAAVPTSVAEYPFQLGRLGALVMHPDGELGDMPWSCAYGAGRRMGATFISESGKDDPTATLFSDKADLRNPEEWLLRLDYSAAKLSDGQAQQKARLAQVKELLVKVMPEDEVEDIRIVVEPGTGTSPGSHVEFKTPYGWVPLRQLGYGYQTLITWVADLANRMVERYPDSPNPSAEPAVVLVDEIDLHLHPVWQRKLMGFLTGRFPNTQFIATAHSPLVAQAAAEANLAVLRREGDHVVIDNDVDNIRNWRIDQILTSDLFGLETARPASIEKRLKERTELLAKPKLSAADQRRLKALEAEIGDLPAGETAEEIRERDEIRKTLDLLRKERQSAR
jgi:AAA domain, putative AbiEii toxin, Type IV TA system/AAA domain